MTIELDRPPSVFDAGFPSVEYDHLPRPEDAHAVLRQARAQAPIALGPHGPELLTYELVHAVLRDPRFTVPPGFTLAAQGITAGELWDRVASSLLSLEGQAHHRLRRLVAKAFAPRAAARIRPTIAGVIDDLVTPLTAVGRCDIVTDVAEKYPIPVICALLGTDRADWRLFSDWTDDIMKTFSWEAAAAEPTIVRSWRELDAYLGDVIEARRHAPTDDLLSELVHAEDDGDRLSREEVLMLASTLLLAGTDTTRNQVAAAVETLCEHPDQWALLAAHPELVPNAVDETLRYSPIGIGLFRSAPVDVELGGVTIPAGTLLLLNGASANRDPGAFADPDRFDVTREFSSQVLTFGGGVHFCLGSHLARAELIEALTVITRRMPNPRRRACAPWKPLTGVTGPSALPLEFDTGF
ncbi:cytochrome P450 hydroxylase [Mycolicibacterium chitae]|uniref:Steroid C26-monooxygenase n=1 Tax=Mycolicibacterium chitae TaxID=1792 RepID=A0A3S4VF24_MYCCI|nr:cytochrome P450 [Mycolicibacterium chitae]MCV7105534.1 cytochrome P450 [Mycolicibacterium chitae]BBZ01295.1 cytochrome P450 hydroxylase [Mycolicibacterium chitae]VEG50134.1 cytochrome P450 133B1 [Mycolicibacterium chitae]